MTMLRPCNTDRILILAPHPDDETLACGGLVQRALASGACVSIIIATNGDANPWPQRIAERRWTLGSDAAARWGALRVREAREALGILGAVDGAIQFLGWPDQGLTALMETGSARGVAILKEVLDAFEPTIVVAPSLFDSHPDHSALALLLHAALRATAPQARALAYWVHGKPSEPAGHVNLALTQAELDRKRKAILAHRTQLHFGRGRMLGHARPGETYFYEQLRPVAGGDSWKWRFSTGGRLAGAFLRRLRVAAVSTDGGLHAATIDLSGSSAAVRRVGATVDIEVAPLWPDADVVIAKLDHRHRLYIYDMCAWAGCRPAADQRAWTPDASDGAATSAHAGKGRERQHAQAVSTEIRREPDMRPWKILCDFDGTICHPDATDEVLERCAAPAWRAIERQWREGTIGSRECMSRQVALIDASPEQLDAVIDGIGIDPAFPRFVSLARALGIELTIVSDGLDYAIHRILRKHGLDGLPVVANRLEHVSERAWRLSSPHANDACSAQSGTCKCAWKALAGAPDEGTRILLIGDGQSDICVAAHADFVFATSKLLAHCRVAGLDHRAIHGFDDAIALLPDLIAGRLGADGAPVTPSPLEFA